MTDQDRDKLPLGEIASACRDFLTVWNDQHAEPAHFGPAVASLAGLLATDDDGCGWKQRYEELREENRLMRLTLTDLTGEVDDATPVQQDTELTAERRHALTFNAITYALAEMDRWVPLDAREHAAAAVLRALSGEAGDGVTPLSNSAQTPVQQDTDLERGRQLASERDDLIAAGVDPTELLVPLAPPTYCGPRDCTDMRCTRVNGRCVGMHCARCGQPCSSQGHTCKEASDDD